MFGWFSKKVMCEQCDKKVAEKKVLRKRGRPFCAEACLSAWVAENPPPRAPGDDPDAHRDEARRLLVSALEDLVIVISANRGSVASNFAKPGALAAIDALNAHEVTQSNLMNYEESALRAVPYLYALDLDEEAERIESVDLTQIYEMSSLMAGPLQQKKVRNILNPVFETVESIAGRVSGLPSPTSSL